MFVFVSTSLFVMAEVCNLDEGTISDDSVPTDRQDSSIVDDLCAKINGML